MLSVNRFAFKEWAVTCAALAAGRQSLLLRKGGIQEHAGRFEVEHREFWLFPTKFHQHPEQIRDDARALLGQLENDAPPSGVVRLALYAIVDEVFELHDEALLPRLASLQILTEDTVEQRFYYRRPGLCVLPVRMFRRAEPVTLADNPDFAGCHTWVDLEQELSTGGLVPVLTDAEHSNRLQDIRRAIQSAG